MSRAKRERAYGALLAALADVVPPCSDDARFVRDAHEYSEEELDALREVCAGCPAVVECGSYGRAARPRSCVWAGRVYRPTVGRPRKELD